MFRSKSTHKKNETEFLEDAMLRILHDGSVQNLADALIAGASESEPLIADALKTPQDVRYHAEGPFLHSHIRSILCTLYAIQKEKLHLIDIEEFRRLKGYEGEVDELEEMIKENIGMFEVFALVHDAAKLACAVFSAPPGSRGEELGFNAPLTYEFDVDAKTRAELLEAYHELFHEFSLTHKEESPQEIQRAFYGAYQIDVHYPHHADTIYTPVYSALLDRFCAAHQLPARDRNILEDLIGNHMRFNEDFFQQKSNKINTFVHIANKRGYDSDDFIDLLQGCLFFDMVCGSQVSSKQGYVHDPTSLIHCLKSEHDLAPERRIEKEALRQYQALRERNRVFQEVGLDGVALLELLGMEPGPLFGKLLRQIHSAIVGQDVMPVLEPKNKKEIESRAERYYKTVFKQGI